MFPLLLLEYGSSLLGDAVLYILHVVVLVPDVKHTPNDEGNEFLFFGTTLSRDFAFETYI